jgi:membrane protease YdiL (CAAX protease family)
MSKTINHKALIPYGWLRALIFYIIISTVAYLVSSNAATIIQNLNTGTTDIDKLLAFTTVYGALAVITIIIALVMRMFIDKESFKSLGFDWNTYGNDGSIGFFSALAILGVGSLILIATNNIAFFTGSIDPLILWLQFFLMILVSVTEEVLFRGYILNNLLTSVNKWIALGLSAIAFALFHAANPGISIFTIATIFLAGLFLGINYIYTRNLWFGIFFHFAWNFFQGPVLGYEVSGLRLPAVLQQLVSGTDLWTGGDFGFEGSFLCPLLILIALLIFALCFQRKYNPA